MHSGGMEGRSGMEGRGVERREGKWNGRKGSGTEGREVEWREEVIVPARTVSS